MGAEGLCGARGYSSKHVLGNRETQAVRVGVDGEERPGSAETERGR